VFKRCREEGLLENNLIRVRVRQPKSGSEEERYTLENCSVEAKFIREKEPTRSEKKNARADTDLAASGVEQTNLSSKGNDESQSANVDAENKTGDGERNMNGAQEESDESSASGSDDSCGVGATMNRFSALM